MEILTAILSTFLGVIVISLVYFFPAIVAMSKGQKDARSILVINLFLGWTAIGWVAALAWAVKK